jgi:photosystem II stability/assembly factor-like uncharacterized protein
MTRGVFRERWRLHRVFVVLATALVLLPQEVPAHDPDTWGGVFRTHDAGATWTSINPGIFVSGALALAVSPRDPNHLLLATDSGVWRSRNGGRDWDVEAPGILTGPAFAAAFDAEGQHTLVAGTSSLFRDDGDRWRPVRTPAGTAPARALVAGAVPGRIYLAGRFGLYRSDDWGRSWTDAGRALEADHVDALLAPPGRPDEVYAVAGGSVWSSNDGARSWQRRAGGPGNGMEAVGFDPTTPARLWAVGAGQVFRSDHPGERWRPVGKPVPETLAVARGMAISGEVIVLATDRGVFRSADGGERWELPKENLPAHLAARVLVGDSLRPATLYAGFALTSYEDLQTRVRGAETASSRSDLGSIVGGFGLVVLLAFGAIAAARHFAHKLR